MKNDVTAQALRERVQELLDNRPDLSRADLRQAIRRGHSWVSEFFSGARTTNDLRLVLKMARFFGVPVGYLLNERGRSENDAQTMTFHAAWDALDKEHRETVLQLALRLRQTQRPSGK